jgi:hypothetical protein
MKNLVKVGVAGALALSGSMAAHAAIAVGTSSNTTTGDVILWANVYNSSGTLVDAYVGDTGVAVANLPAATTFTDSNLNTLLAQGVGNTIIWALGGGNPGGSTGTPLLVSSTNAATCIRTNMCGSFNNGAELQGSGGAQGTQVNSINSIIGTNTSELTTNVSMQGGTGFSPLQSVNDEHNWYAGTNSIAVTGLNVASTLYKLTAAGTAVGNLATYTALESVTLTSAGLVFTAVPLPAAVWLLGSGLLGLAGVARRKIKVA